MMLLIVYLSSVYSLEQEVYRQFRDTSITHLIVTDGFNVVN